MQFFKSGTVSEIFNEADALSSIGLDVPVIAKITAKLKSSGIELSGQLYTVDGALDAIIEYIGEGKR